MSIIATHQLTKVFPGNIRAVDGIDFEVDAGEIFGFLGPNGAGKTTTIKMLNTLIQPTSGTAVVAGLSNYLPNKSNFAATLSNLITSSYNTGWMNGDIKLATLSDTDATNVTGSELVTNGTFDTDTTGWTAMTGASVSHSSGQMTVTSSGSATWNGAYQQITGLL